MRYLAIDLGDKRTGVAVGDEASGIVSPLQTIQARRGDALLDALLRVIEQQSPDGIVIGLPVNMDDTEGNQAKLTREFGEQLRQRCDTPISFQDERLTSFAADQQMAQSGRTHGQKKRLRDALAAAQILRDFLDQRDGDT